MNIPKINHQYINPLLDNGFSFSCYNFETQKWRYNYFSENYNKNGFSYLIYCYFFDDFTTEQFITIEIFWDILYLSKERYFFQDDNNSIIFKQLSLHQILKQYPQNSKWIISDYFVVFDLINKLKSAIN